ncbi:MAG: DedA family protein [Thermofilum sp.]|nr:DedA family protein [Thermofilum sp.]
MSLAVSIVEASAQLLERLGLLGLFALSAAELLLAPIPGEIVIALAGFLSSRGVYGLHEVILAGSLGNLVGSAAEYLLGLYLARPALLRLGRYLFIEEEDIARAEGFFRGRSGFAAVLVGRMVPGIRSVIGFPAGMARMNPLSFALATVAGSLPWNTFFAYLGYTLGERWQILLSYSSLVDAVGALALLAAAAYVLARLRASGRSRSGTRTRGA